MNPKPGYRFHPAIPVILSMTVFAAFPAGNALSWASLGLAGVIMATVLFTDPSPAHLIGFSGGKRHSLLLLAAGILTGASLGFLDRTLSPVPPMPETMLLPGLLTPLVGMTEEIVYRGFVQGTIQKYSRIWAVILASAGHTLYKSVLLASALPRGDPDLVLLTVLTFTTGCLFGVFRICSGRIYAPLAAHGLFDLLVYGDHTTMPAWVWY
ncbi:MAG: CPBP family intramembrane glutamic endopeptidase [Bacteroidales bacterium]